MTLPSLGEDFGRYRLVRELGRGGMGIVYAALDSSLDREVALKIIAPQWAEDPDYRVRFKREALALSRVESTHVVAVHDYGELDGRLYLVTQLVPDGDLFHLIRAHGALVPSAALDVMVQVLGGLADAHAAGVVHRDVKPSNILLRRRAGRLDAVLCDFGIATTQGGDATRTGALVGSFPYMAPERHQGEVAGAAADVYSVGCVLWQVLTGTAPYAGSDVEIAMAHLQAPLPQLPPGDRFVTALNAVLAKSLAKRPGDRYPSARAMRADLAAAAALAPSVLVLPDVTAVRHAITPGVVTTPPPRQRRRVAAVLLAVAAVVAAAVGAYAIASGGSPGRVDPLVDLADEVGSLPLATSSSNGLTSDTLGDISSGPGATGAKGSKTPGESPTTARAAQGAGAGPDASAVPSDDGPTAPSGQQGVPTDRAPSPQPTRQPSQAPTRSPSQAATPTPTPAPSTNPPAPAYDWQCWNGTKTFGPEQCTDPTGRAGVDWVFLAPSGCSEEATEGGARVTRVVCIRQTPYGRGEIRYAQWKTAGDVRAYFTDKFGEQPSGWRDGWGTFWAQRTPQREVAASRANLYGDQPMSVQFSAVNDRAQQWLLESIDYRAPEYLKGRPIS